MDLFAEFYLFHLNTYTDVHKFFQQIWYLFTTKSKTGQFYSVLCNAEDADRFISS